MGSRFVQPEEVTLPISDGDTLTVKRWLSEGERREAYARLYRPDGALNVQEVRIAMVLAYLLDWTLTDAENRKVTLRGKSPDDMRAHLDALHPEDFDEIHEAIKAHETRQAEARQEKKRQKPATVSEATSLSVV